MSLEAKEMQVTGMDIGALQQAILCLFDPSTPQQTKQSAELYCAQFRQSSQMWSVSWALFTDTSKQNEIRFWALAELTQFVRDVSKYNTIAEETRVIIRKNLILQLRNTSHQEQIYIKNKFAALIVLVLKVDYPERWESVFREIFETLQHGPLMIDMFLRILNIIDEEIVQFHISRTPSEVTHNTLIKDTMRGGVLENISNAVYQIVLTYQSSLPDLSVSCLNSFEKYIGWIELPLTANERMVPLLFGLLQNQNLRESACNCIRELVVKGMDSNTRVALYDGLQLHSNLNPYIQGDDYDFHEKIAEILTSASQELLQICIEVNRDDPNSLSTATRAYGLVFEYLPSLYVLFGSESDDVCEMCQPFVEDLLQYLKKFPRGAKEMEVVQKLLVIISNKILFDEDYDFDEPEDSEEQFDEFRRGISSIFKNLSKLAPDYTIHMIGQIITRSLSLPREDGFQMVESGLFLLYQFGEGLSEDSVKPNGGLVPIMTMLSTSELSSHPHIAVLDMFYENVTRYHRFYIHHPQYIPAILSCFLGTGGIRHPSEKLRGRVCVLFARFLKNIKTSVHPYLENMLTNLRECLVVSLQPVPNFMSNDEQAQVFQAVGSLIGTEVIPPPTQEHYLEAIITPILVQIEPLASKEPFARNTPQTIVLSQQICHIINSIGLFSKGFPRVVAQARPCVVAYFKKSLAVVVSLLVPCCNIPEVQEKIISFMHRMVDTIGEAVTEFVPNALTIIFRCETPVFVELVRLINQFLGKFPTRINAIVDELFLSVLGRITSLQQPQTSQLRNTETERERLELKRLMFQYIQAVTSNSPDILLSERNSAQLMPIISMVVQNLVEEQEMAIRKICCFMLSKMIQEWTGPGASKLPAFSQYVFETIVPALFRCPAHPNFDTSDAMCVGVWNELSNLQMLLYSKFSETYLVYLRDSLFPRLEIPASRAQDFFRAVTAGDQNGLRVFMKAITDARVT